MSYLYSFNNGRNKYRDNYLNNIVLNEYNLIIKKYLNLYEIISSLFYSCPIPL